ncbi:MAG: hypothetical protein PHU06_03620 [Gallionella sp.]|nr:hypothetical protein [Gallionella sp.]MDD4958368.1 hypothetical protein [Gallionella sp.]
MSYTILYYSQAVEQAVLELPAGLLARYFSLTDRMISSGANCRRPTHGSLWRRLV